MRKPLHTLVLAIALAMTAQLGAQIPNNYYNNAEGKSGEALKTALHDIIKGHTSISYQQIWNAFYSTDNKGNNIVWDMYSSNNFTLGQNQCGSYENEGDCYNREHSWPESWFNGNNKPRTDLHHIFPTDGFVNNKRGNNPFGVVRKASWTSSNGSKLGSSNVEGYSGTVFEPIDTYKGDFARAIMYMSVRYYSEDANWGNSPMTTKAEIKPWAITMLMQWNDDDPVSEKEIDRNNAVYAIQGNRNPFIDHPEYARMIWDEDWHDIPTYAITCAPNLQNGSVSASHSTAVAGTSIQLSATPMPGYMLDSWNVYKTNNASIAITVNHNTFVMPDYDVTVSASFVPDLSLYNLTLGNVSHGSISVNGSTNPSPVLSGSTISLAASPDPNYTLYAWYVHKTGDMSTLVEVNNNSFVMPSFDVTVVGTFILQSSTGNTYMKVTSAPTDWSGEYILVYESSASQGFVWKGIYSDEAYDTKAIDGNTITGENLVTLTLAPMNGGYSIKVNGGTNNGKYIYGVTNQNDVKFSDSPQMNSLSMEDGSVKIVSNTSVMRFNSSASVFRYYKSSTYSNQQPVQLYKKQLVTPTHNINFNPNGGSGNMEPQSVEEFVATPLMANTFTRENHVFDSWNTQADGSGTYYNDESTVTLLDDLDLYAQWDQLYAIEVLPSQHGTVTVSHETAIEGTTVTLTATPDDASFAFDEWNVTDAQGNPIGVIENQFEMPASEVSVSASFIYVGEPYVQQYYLVTSTDQLVAGRTYLIVNTNAEMAMGKNQNNNNRSAVSISIEDNVIPEIENTVCELTLGGQSGAWTFFDPNWNNTGGYLYAASSSSNQLKTQANNNDNGKWDISFGDNGAATIVAQGSNTRNHLRYNPNNNTPIFNCYQSNSTMALVELYIRSEEFNFTENTTVAQLFPFDKHVVHPGATLTVTGTANITEASHLTIEDGGQIIHNSPDVKAIVKKSFEPYSASDNGWYLIASPITEDNLPDEMTIGSYDLYRFDQTHELEWCNHKVHHFLMENTEGYLYASNAEVDARFIGTLNPSDQAMQKDLVLDGDAYFSGWNLIGNPFACTAYLDGNIPFYRMNLDRNELTPGSGAIAPMEGVFVQASNTLASVSFTNTVQRDHGHLSLMVGQQANHPIDQAIIGFGEGLSLDKFMLDKNNSKLYIPQDGKDFAVIRSSGQGEVPVSFKASENGTYTISIDTDNVEMDYLHLVDHLTGADIDLLVTPDYTFEAKTTDYTSRFKLVFNPNGETEENESFAYVSNGEIVVNGKGTLQIIDVMGRVIRSTEIVRNVSTIGMAPGVYVLRIMNSEGPKTQKIVLQ